VSVIDCRDEKMDHLDAVVMVRPADEAAHLGVRDTQLLGALVEGWDDERIRSVLGLADPTHHAEQLAGRLGLQSIVALVQHAAREGLSLPPALWH
jgi:hypothetical protein